MSDVQFRSDFMRVLHERGFVHPCTDAAALDAKAAAAILEAQRRAVENIQAGLPASNYIASPPVAPAPSPNFRRAARAHRPL